MTQAKILYFRFPTWGTTFEEDFDNDNGIELQSGKIK